MIKAMTEIKYKAGQEVFWLSSAGFTKGWVKRVLFSEEFDAKTRKIRTDFKYYLTTENNHDIYMGDAVDESLVFVSYKEMIDYYSNLKP
jgi:hypothetical protein